MSGQGAYPIPRKLRRCFSLSDVQDRARRVLPFPIYDYIIGGADDERVIAANRSAFAEYSPGEGWSHQPNAAKE